MKIPVAPFSNIRNRVLLFVVAGLALAGLAGVGRRLVTADLDSLTPAPHAVFHIFRPQTGVNVPFTNVRGLIVLHASLDGKDTLCILDTGSATALIGNDLPGQPLHQQMDMVDSAGRQQTYEKRLLRSVRIGGLELTNVRGFRRQSIQRAPSLSASPISPVLIGSAFFKDTILTIDYRSQTLSIYPASAAPLAAPPSVNDILLDFTYDGVTAADVWGVPSVAGTIEGKSVRCVIDTGWNLPEIGVSSAVFATLKPDRQRTSATRSFVFGSASVKTLPQIHTEIGPLQQDGPVLESPLLGLSRWIPGAIQSDIVVGAVNLETFKVTFDYPAHKIRLTPPD